MNRLIGGLIPLFGWQHERWRHHLDGGEQKRTLSVTWLRRRWDFAYSSPWKKRVARNDTGGDA